MPRLTITVILLQISDIVIFEPETGVPDTLPIPLIKNIRQG